MNKLDIQFAPMQGQTDAIYRRLHQQAFGGVSAYYTPFIRLEKGALRKRDRRELLPEAKGEEVVIPQLMARDPQELRTLLEQVSSRRIDLNLGCPFPKQVRAHYGSGLWPYPDEVKALLDSLAAYPDRVFSLKIRLGLHDVEEVLSLVPYLNTLPVHQITVHPRLGIQQYKGTVDLEAFARFSEACTLPLYYSGDLMTLEDLDRIQVRFPTVAGVLWGRGLLAHPWLANVYTTEIAWDALRKRTVCEQFHADLLAAYSERLEGGNHQIVKKMKEIWTYFLPEGDPKGRKKIKKSHSLASYEEGVACVMEKML